eukprot:TRINITY_DN571_c0_g1_i1.p1 TRINITY_DN571_c0_g1~~TRINITY_DN571_c0_g1_i1.p1  ORF type:complete len:423 (-),score=101.48 TRINITY_DN571_c0_g1_i1:4-1239(-)
MYQHQHSHHYPPQQQYSQDQYYEKDYQQGDQEYDYDYAQNYDSHDQNQEYYDQEYYQSAEDYYSNEAPNQEYSDHRQEESHLNEQHQEHQEHQGHYDDQQQYYDDGQNYDENYNASETQSHQDDGSYYQSEEVYGQHGEEHSSEYYSEDQNYNSEYYQNQDDYQHEETYHNEDEYYDGSYDNNQFYDGSYDQPEDEYYTYGEHSQIQSTSVSPLSTVYSSSPPSTASPTLSDGNIRSDSEHFYTETNFPIPKLPELPPIPHVAPEGVTELATLIHSLRSLKFEEHSELVPRLTQLVSQSTKNEEGFVEYGGLQMICCCLVHVSVHRLSSKNTVLYHLKNLYTDVLFKFSKNSGLNWDKAAKSVDYLILYSMRGNNEPFEHRKPVLQLLRRIAQNKHCKARFSEVGGSRTLR